MLQARVKEQQRQLEATTQLLEQQLALLATSEEGGNAVENVHAGAAIGVHGSTSNALVPVEDFQDITNQLSQSLSEASPPKENKFPWEKPSARSFTAGNVSIDIHKFIAMPHQTRLNNTTLFEQATPGTIGSTDVYFPPAEQL